jgi:predicted MPP superfamily phosphohydrolase
MSTIRKNKMGEVKSKPLNLLWVTDLHLAHIPPEKASIFIKEMANKNPSLVVITGDISTAVR